MSSRSACAMRSSSSCSAAPVGPQRAGQPACAPMREDFLSTLSSWRAGAGSARRATPPLPASRSPSAAIAVPRRNSFFWRWLAFRDVLFHGLRGTV